MCSLYPFSRAPPFFLYKWHLGRGGQDQYLPSNRGFDHYFGIPFSQDMGMSAWEPVNFEGAEPFQPTPLPLLNGTTIVEQPTGLHTLAQRYADAAVDFINAAAKAGKPFLLYLAFNHVHEPNSCGPAFCGVSAQGQLGDAVEEMDWALGQVMAAIEAAGRADETLTFFTSDNGHPLGNDKDGNLPLRDGKSSTWEVRGT